MNSKINPQCTKFHLTSSHTFAPAVDYSTKEIVNKRIDNKKKVLYDSRTQIWLEDSF
jgi:hypothetical protein